MSWGFCRLPLESAQPPSHFLVRAGLLEVVVVLSQAPSSDSNSCHYAIVRGRGNEKSRGDNTRVKEAMLSFPHFQQGRMKTKSKDLPFIHGPFKGRFNPNTSLSLFALYLPLLAHGLYWMEYNWMDYVTSVTCPPSCLKFHPWNLLCRLRLQNVGCHACLN